MRREKPKFPLSPILSALSSFFLDDRMGGEENFGAIIRLDGLGGCPKNVRETMMCVEKKLFFLEKRDQIAFPPTDDSSSLKIPVGCWNGVSFSPSSRKSKIHQTLKKEARF